MSEVGGAGDVQPAEALLEPNVATVSGPGRRDGWRVAGALVVVVLLVGPGALALSRQRASPAPSGAVITAAQLQALDCVSVIGAGATARDAEVSMMTSASPAQIDAVRAVLSSQAGF